MTDAGPDASAPTWTALDLAQHVAQLAYDMQAEEALILHVSDALQVTDYFVICEGRNKRHVNAVAQHVAAELKKTGLHRIGGSDLHDERWVLLDFGPVVLHVFAPDAREFYDLENLWGDCERVDWTPFEPCPEAD
jgi:ribosome-associated protein